MTGLELLLLLPTVALAVPAAVLAVQAVAAGRAPREGTPLAPAATTVAAASTAHAASAARAAGASHAANAAPATPAGTARPRVAVLMPAHNEAAGIADALGTVRPQLRPGPRWRRATTLRGAARDSRSTSACVAWPPIRPRCW